MLSSGLYLPTQMLSQTPHGSILNVPTSQLLEYCGIIRKETTGVYGYPPMGAYVMRRIRDIVTQTFRDHGFQEFEAGLLQNTQNWKSSGRWEKFRDYMFPVGNGDKICLSPTHEESVLRMLGNSLSYRDLPIRIFQIGKKFRSHRARSGLQNVNEFEMVDAYMFHDGNAHYLESIEMSRMALKQTFEVLCLDTYEIFEDNRIDYLYQDAYEGNRELPDHATRFTGSGVDTDNSDGHNAYTELARIQHLGTGIPENMGISYAPRDSIRGHFNMACCGVGTGRLLLSMTTRYRDEKGVAWPDTVLQFTTAVIPTDPTRTDLMDVARRIEDREGKRRTIIDNRQISLGRRIRDMDMIGCHRKTLVGSRELRTGLGYMEFRDGTKSEYRILP